MPSLSRLIRKKSASAPQLKLPDSEVRPGKKDQSSFKHSKQRSEPSTTPIRPEVQPPVNSKGRAKSVSGPSSGANIYQLPSAANTHHVPVSKASSTKESKRSGTKRASAPAAAVRCPTGPIFPISILKRPVSSPPSSTRISYAPRSQSPRPIHKSPSVHFRDQKPPSSSTSFPFGDSEIKVIRPQYIVGSAKQPTKHESNILNELRSWAGAADSQNVPPPRSSSKDSAHHQHQPPHHEHYASPHMPHHPIPYNSNTRRLPNYTIPLNDSQSQPHQHMLEPASGRQNAPVRPPEEDTYRSALPAGPSNHRNAHPYTADSARVRASTYAERDTSPMSTGNHIPRLTAHSSSHPSSQPYSFPPRNDHTPPSHSTINGPNATSQDRMRGVSHLKTAFEAKMAHESRLAGRQSQSPTPSLIDQRRGSAASTVLSEHRKTSEASTTIAKLSARTAAADARIRSLTEEIDGLRRELDRRKRADEANKRPAKGDQQRVADLDLLLSYLNDMVHVTTDISSCCQGTSNISHILWEDELVPPHSSSSEPKPQIQLFVAHLTHLLRIVQYLAQRAVQLESLVRGRSRGNTVTRGQVLARVGQEMKDIEAMILGAEQERRRWEESDCRSDLGLEEEVADMPKPHFPFYDVDGDGEDVGGSDGESDKTELMDDDMGPFATPVTSVSGENRRSARLTKLVGDEKEDVSSNQNPSLGQDGGGSGSPAASVKSASNVSEFGTQTEHETDTREASDTTLTNQLALANLLIHTKEDIITELESQLESSEVEVERLNQHNWELKLQNEHLKAMGEAKEKVVEELLRRLGELEDARSAAGMVQTVMTLIEATDIKEKNGGEGDDGATANKVVPNLAGMLGLRSVRSADRILLAPAAPPPCVPLPTVPVRDGKGCSDNGPTHPLPILPVENEAEEMDNGPTQPLPDLPVGPSCEGGAQYVDQNATYTETKVQSRTNDRHVLPTSRRNMELLKSAPVPSFISASPSPSVPVIRSNVTTRPRSTVRARPATPVARNPKMPPTSPPTSPRLTPTTRVATPPAGRARAASSAPNATKVNRSRRAGADAVATFPGRGPEKIGTFPRPGTVASRSKAPVGPGAGKGGVVGGATTGNTGSVMNGSVRSGIPTAARATRMPTPPASPLMNGGYGRR